MPLCFPEKITSGPADMAEMGAEPKGMGLAAMKGVDAEGGTMPKSRVGRRQ